MPSRPDKPALSQSYISDSGEDEKTEREMTKRRISEKNKSLKVDEEPQSDDSDTSEASEASKSDETSDEEESEEEEDDDDDDSTSTSSDQSSDDSQSQSSNQSKRARQEEDGARQDHQPKRQKNSSSTEASTGTTSVKSFVPPTGFKPLVLESSDLETESSQMFSALDAKQVWHICAPASVNVASIKELDLEAALRGEAILSENGVSYSMQEMQTDSSLVLMRGSSGVYRPSSAKVARSFRLAVKAGGSSSSGGSSSNSSKASSAPAQNPSGLTFVAQSPGQKKPPRKQPEVLGMRYLPFGAETKVRSAAAGTSSAPPPPPQTQSPARKKRSQPAKDIAIQDPMLSPSVSPIPRSSTKPTETGSASSKKSKAARAT